MGKFRVGKSTRNTNEVKQVKKEIQDNLKHLNRCILKMFGLEENDNLGMMREPNIQELEKLLYEVDFLQTYYREVA